MRLRDRSSEPCMSVFCDDRIEGKRAFAPESLSSFLCLRESGRHAISWLLACIMHSLPVSADPSSSSLFTNRFASISRRLPLPHDIENIIKGWTGRQGSANRDTTSSSSYSIRTHCSAVQQCLILMSLICMFMVRQFLCPDSLTDQLAALIRVW